MSNVRWMLNRPTRRRRVAVFLSFLLAVALVIGQAQSAQCWFFYTGDQADSALGANTIVDIKYDGTYLWLATGRGVTRAKPDGSEFVNYGRGVLNKGEVSAVAAQEGEVWVSPSYSEVHSEQLIPYGAGFNVTFDDGLSWESSFAEQATGAGKICYDIAFLNSESSVWATCFYGGLIRSRDGGTNWENVFPSAQAAADYLSGTFGDLNNRFFAVTTDETIADSISVWAGSAAGIKRFLFIDPSLKLTGTYASDLLLAGDTVWLATEAGLSFSLDIGRTWVTFAEDDGFPTPSYVASAYAGPNGIWAGVGSDFDSTTGVSTGAGIMFSPDGGESWQFFDPPEAIGPGRLATCFAVVNDVTFVACGEGGLIYSINNGMIWDFELPGNATAGAYYSLITQEVDPDTVLLWAGTDDDLYEFVFTSAGLYIPDTLIKHTITELSDTTSMSRTIKAVKLQDLPDGNRILWTLHHATESGFDFDGFAYSIDGGESWERIIGSAKPFDVGFADSVYYVGTDLGVAKDKLGSPVGSQTWLENLDDILGGDDGTTNVRSLLVSGDSVWVGSDVGIAISPDSGATWSKVVSNPSPGIPDDTLHYRAGEGDAPISGNFVTALATQQYLAKKGIWAATQQTSSSQTNGVSVTFDDGATWDIVLSGVLVWNFAFDGPTVYAATSQGLMISPDYGEKWDTIDVFIDFETGHEISKHTEVYAVAAVGDTVWVGTENGLAISFDRGENWQVKRRYESVDEPYATPVPYSPSDQITPGYMYFHFRPPVDGPVNITVYDFSNRKVVEIVDETSLAAGEEYHQTHYWDGKHDDGNNVAVGTYFFVVEYADGSTQWGKLMILP